jgi:hypothetical protein
MEDNLLGFGWWENIWILNQKKIIKIYYFIVGTALQFNKNIEILI